MAQTDDIQEHSSNDQRVQNSLQSNSSKAQTSPTFQQLLQRDGSKWSHIALQKHDQEVNGSHHNKMSVLAKVKEKAKKLKYSLIRKKDRDEIKSRCASATRASGAGPKDDEDDAEYHSARMYESKHTPASTSKNHLEKSKDNPTRSSNTKKETQSNNRAPSETSDVAANTGTKNLVPTTTDVPKVQQLSDNNSRFLGLTMSTQESVAGKGDKSIEEEGENMKGESQTRDKGVSVKEYLMHKFEPGEDERALSKVITQTISPRRAKMREAMSSFLKNEEPSEAKSSNVDNKVNVNVNFKSKSLPTSTDLNTKTGSKIASLKQSNSLNSNASNVSSNLNNTFRSTFASYQVHFLGTSSNHNTKLYTSTTSFNPNPNSGSNDSLTRIHSPMKTGSSPLSHASSASRSPPKDPVSTTSQTRVPRHTATSVRRIHVSSANRTRVPISTTNQTNDSETRSRVST